MSTKTKQIISTVTVFILTLCEAVGLYMRITMYDDKNIYLFYTENSNMLSLLVGIIFTVTSVICLIRKRPIPRLIHQLRYMVTTCLVITFLVVLFILTPTYAMMPVGAVGFSPLLRSAQFLLGKDAMFFEHFFCPVLSLLSFTVFENGKPLSRSSLFVSLIPTFVYGGIFIPLNILKIVKGPYPFLYVYEQPVWMSCVWFVVVFGLAFLVSLGIRALHNIPFRRALQK